LIFNNINEDEINNLNEKINEQSKIFTNELKITRDKYIDEIKDFQLYLIDLQIYF
jgi:hypothetical protein